jgi:FMN-dependent NADH-azoreductase
MSTLLHIDSSPLGAYSVTRHLTNEFVQSWKAANPNGTVITRDLNATTIPPITGAWVGAVYTPADALTSEQKELTALSNTLVDELFAADEYVIGVPMHNFSIPSPLKLWIDQVARKEKTFSYATGTPVGLLTGKTAHIITSSGGSYDIGTAYESLNHVQPYLKSLFGFLGVKDLTFVNVGGAAALMAPQADRPAFLKPHVDAIRGLFQTV